VSPVYVLPHIHSREKGKTMNFDPGQLNQLLSHVPFPMSKTDLVQFAQQHGANDQIIGLLRTYPNRSAARYVIKAPTRWSQPR
jgi:hypothetical protein